MQNKNNTKIYSIQNSNETSELIEIETIILNGLYRFSILGINQKHSSEIKDRVYSALRSQKLLNLKSDNKKITVNLLPTNIDKKDNFYDLSIAISCLINTNQLFIENDILVMGELSIVGNIIPSKYLLKSIYCAIENSIKIIICSNKDLEIFNKYENNIYDLIEKNQIKFICADTLGELFLNIKNNIFYNFLDEKTFTIKTCADDHVEIFDENIFKIILAVCTKRNVFIENKKDSYIQKFIKNLIYYNNKLNNSDLLKISSILNKDDERVLNDYRYPVIKFIDKQTPKDNINEILKESYFGFNVIYDFISINEDVLHIIKTNHKSSLLCFYNACPCGNNNLLFNSFNDDKCLCLQRNILRYRQKLKKVENGFFDFYIKNIVDIQIPYSSNDYININKIINNFKDMELEVTQKQSIEDLMGDTYSKYDKQDIDKIMDLSKDIVKLEHIIKKYPLILSKESIFLAIDFIKKDF